MATQKKRKGKKSKTKQFCCLSRQEARLTSINCRLRSTVERQKVCLCVREVCVCGGGGGGGGGWRGHHWSPIK